MFSELTLNLFTSVWERRGRKTHLGGEVKGTEGAGTKLWSDDVPVLSTVPQYGASQDKFLPRAPPLFGLHHHRIRPHLPPSTCTPSIEQLNLLRNKRAHQISSPFPHLPNLSFHFRLLIGHTTTGAR